MTDFIRDAYPTAGRGISIFKKIDADSHTGQSGSRPKNSEVIYFFLFVLQRGGILFVIHIKFLPFYFTTRCNTLVINKSPPAVGKQGEIKVV